MGPVDAARINPNIPEGFEEFASRVRVEFPIEGCEDLHDALENGRQGAGRQHSEYFRTILSISYFGFVLSGSVRKIHSYGCFSSFSIRP